MMSPSTDWQRVAAWRAEIDRSKALAETHWHDWQQNLDSYIGNSPDAVTANANQQDWVNTNADFVNCEVKLAQLFYEQPDLQLTAKGEFKTKPPAAPIPGAPPPQALPGVPIVAAHRELLNELLGIAHANVLETIHKAIKDCLVTAGVGATKIGYTATMEDVQPPEQYGAILGLQQGLQRPIDERWYWDRIPSKKLRIPADFMDTDFDRSPWLGMNFRMPLTQAKRLFDVPEDVSGTSERDTNVLNETHAGLQTTSVPYVDGIEIWYLAHIFDEDVIHPLVIRRHVLIDGVDQFVEKTNASPFQTVLPSGRLSADSMIGYPIHPLAIRTVPDSAYVPSDATMTRPLVRELCKFRTQLVQEREANRPRIAYDASKITPETLRRIEEGTIGSMIPVQEDALANGIDRIMAQVTQGSQTRGSYSANDYIQHDLDKTLGVDATGAGVAGKGERTATEISAVDRLRNARLDAERRRVLQWYLKGVEKYSALVCRFMTPQLAIPYIGQQAAQTWAQWDKKTWDGRFVFHARPDSQIRLDAATERKFALDVYQMTVRDPRANGEYLLRNLFEKAGFDVTQAMAGPPPPKKPDPPGITFSLKAEDLLGPAADQVREVLAQGGIQISQQAVQASTTQLFQQMSMGIRDASGHAVKAAIHPAEHGGPAEQVRPLDQQSADQSGQRSGQKPMVS